MARARWLRWLGACVVSVSLGACTDGEQAASVASPASESALPSAPDLASGVAGRPADEPGCAVGVAAGDGAATAAYGLADLETGRPIDDATLFDLGSVSKQLTGALVLELVADRTLALDHTVGAHLSEVTGPASRVTIEQLLHHRSGIPDYTNRLRQRLDDAATQADAIESIARAPLAFEPGSRFRYSNSNFVLLAEIADRSADPPFADLVADRVLAPAGMSTAFVHDYRDTPLPMATSYRRTGADDFVPLRWRWSQVGDGAVHASITDVLAWGRHLLEPARLSAFIDGAEPVSASGASRYGAGVFVREVRGRPVVDHDGTWQGFVSYVAVFPDDGITVAALCNRLDADPYRLALDALRTGVTRGGCSGCRGTGSWGPTRP